jgi:hypothetical protein
MVTVRFNYRFGGWGGGYALNLPANSSPGIYRGFFALRRNDVAFP